MSLELRIYTEEINDNIIPAWIGKMNEAGMSCQIHPDFSFATQSGFLPFKIKLDNPLNRQLIGKDLLSGFEMYIETFDILKEKEKLKPQKTFLQKLFRAQEQSVYFVDANIDQKLKECNKLIIIIWGSADSLELRIALLSAAIITRLTNGICNYPADGIWYDNYRIIDEAMTEILNYEKSLKDDDWKVHEFEKWN